MRSFFASTAVALLLVVGSLDSVKAQDLEKGISALQEGNYQIALRELRPLAEGGNPTAQYYYAFMHQYGQGIPIDFNKYIYWLNKSSENNYIDAHKQLGYIYLKGDIYVEKDAKKSFYYF